MGTRKSWSGLLFSVTGSIEFELCAQCDTRTIVSDIQQAIAWADTEHPWREPDHRGNIPSIGRLEISTSAQADTGCNRYVVHIEPFFPLASGQLCAYHRYTETLAAQAVSHLNASGMVRARVSLKMGSCFGEWFAAPEKRTPRESIIKGMNPDTEHFGVLPPISEGVEPTRCCMHREAKQK